MKNKHMGLKKKKNSLRKTPRRFTKSNTKLRRIADLHTHTKQDFINKLFTYISLSRNFVIEVHHALFLHLKLKFEITVIFLIPD